MAGAMHPPFRRKKFRSAPSPPGGEDCARSIPSSSPHKIYDFAGAPLLRKERMRHAQWKRENGGAQVVPTVDTHVSSPRRGASGGFGGRRIVSLLFSLPLPWRLRGWLAYRLLSVGATALGGPFFRACRSIGRPLPSTGRKDMCGKPWRGFLRLFQS